MKFTKPHKLCFALAVSAIIGVSLADDVKADYKNEKPYSIKDMMQRRSKGIKPVIKKKPTLEKKVSKKEPIIIERKNTDPKVIDYSACENGSCDVSAMPVEKAGIDYANVDIPAAIPVSSYSPKKDIVMKVTPVEPKTQTSKPWFASGPIFDTGSCQRSHKSGPIFDTGPCQRSYKSGPIFDTGSCQRCYSGPLIDTGPCEKCKPAPAPQLRIANYEIPYNDDVYQAVSRDCCSMAPIYLEHVDFKLSKEKSATSFGDKVGNYRFRIFGCRRYDKEAILNQGRIMEKDMNFSKVFEDVTGDCYNIVKMPQDLCLQDNPTPLPEYILTAEITDVFMNVCDGYDWQQSKKTDSRTGSAEIKVTWRLTNLTKTSVVWEGETSGYSDLTDGMEKGEIDLVEKAFADAVSNLRNEAGFEDKLSVRLTPEELTSQRNALIDEEIALNPAKCKFKEEQDLAKNCEVTRPDADITKCPLIQHIFVEPECQYCEDCPACEPVIPEIVEDSGVIVASSTTNTPEIVEDSGVIVASSTTNVPEIVEDSGVIVAHSVTKTPEIVEDAGVKADSIVFNNCIDENGGVIAGGNCAVVDDTWIDVKQGDKSFDSLCIADRKPYEVLTPGNLYKVRASVVEISNMAGVKGAGLIISESFILTSANLVDKDNNNYLVKTINGGTATGKAVRVNLSKNTALIMLDEVTKYTPLSLNLDLPKVGQGGFMTLGVLDVEDFEDGENYLDTDGKVTGYRYSEDKGSEIMIDTYVQNVTIGGVLIDANGTINGIAHTGKKTDNGTDLYLPTETALRSLGLSICEKLYEKKSPWQQTVYKPVTELILKSAPKAPEAMVKEERK